MPTSGSPIVNFLNNAIQRRIAQSSEQTTAQTPTAPLTDGTNTDANVPDVSRTNQVAKTYRKPQNVLPLSRRIEIVKWMLMEVERSGTEKHLSTKTVNHFPQFFKNTKKANYMRAICLWRERGKLHGDAATRGKRGHLRMQSVSAVSKVAVKRVIVKARSGRGRKRAPWVVALQSDLAIEFERYRKLSVNFSAKVLRALAQDMVRVSTKAQYNLDTIIEPSQRAIIRLITPRWVQTFMHRFSIVERSQCGKLQISPEPQEKVERLVAFSLGMFTREFAGN